ncbi:MAG: asparaginase [Gammaproteobacteria bacterium]|nr:MAG: asparaginase [Gammaproteobacteria bacterium]UCH40498.1 MAG: asparaginase [Gammaproteobacteria bacterium]
MSIKIFTTGGTFDKIYFDAKSEYHIGEPMAASLLEEANVVFDFEIESLLKKDSLDIDEADRELIRNAVVGVDNEMILITHGSDTMVETALDLLDISDKTIVLLGAMQPARMRYSDAMFNLGFACAAVQLLPRGVHLAMNGKVFDPRQVIKNRAESRFEPRA